MRSNWCRVAWVLVAFLCVVYACGAEAPTESRPPAIEPFFNPPPELANRYGDYRSPLRFYDGRSVAGAAQWPQRRREILQRWQRILGAWPPLIDRPKMDVLATTRRENFSQQQVRLEIAPSQSTVGYLLIPDGTGPFPAVLVVYYDPETSVGLATKSQHRDFAYQLTQRGFVTLSIGSPGGDARKPDIGAAKCQPLSFLAYIAANCHTALTHLPIVDPDRIAVMGHSYGGKWALFASCLYDRFACAVWSDPGIVFDEQRPNVNYWEPWYLGYQTTYARKPGLITPDNPRTGAYKQLIENGHDLHELHALMAPRPFLVSGGSEDPPSRWLALNHAVAVNTLLGYTHRVAMTHRDGHSPTAESNQQIYQFFEYALKRGHAEPIGNLDAGVFFHKIDTQEIHDELTPAPPGRTEPPAAGSGAGGLRLHHRHRHARLRRHAPASGPPPRRPLPREGHRALSDARRDR